ncbi:MAG: hypothetical protein ACHREM_04675 [Polyangiales bacterium]
MTETRWGVWCVQDASFCPETVGTAEHARAALSRWASGEAAAVDPAHFTYQLREWIDDRKAGAFLDRPTPNELVRLWQFEMNCRILDQIFTGGSRDAAVAAGFDAVFQAGIDFERTRKGAGHA